MPPTSTTASHQFRSKWAHETLTTKNMRSWAHAQTPTPKHSCSSEQIKQGHVPTSCGTPVVEAATLRVHVLGDTASDQRVGGTAGSESADGACRPASAASGSGPRSGPNFTAAFKAVLAVETIDVLRNAGAGAAGERLRRALGGHHSA
jgi:hypothetical protein